MRYLALVLVLVFVSAFIVGCKSEEPSTEKTCPTCGATLAPDGTCPKCSAKEAGEAAGDVMEKAGEAAEDATKKAEETADDATKAIEGALKGNE